MGLCMGEGDSENLLLSSQYLINRSIGNVKIFGNCFIKVIAAAYSVFKLFTAAIASRRENLI